jgi:hypothetical protein
MTGSHPLPADRVRGHGKPCPYGNVAAGFAWLYLSYNGAPHARGVLLGKHKVRPYNVADSTTGRAEGRSPSAFFIIPQEWGTKGLMTSPRASDVSMTDSASGGFCYTVHLDSRLRGNDRGSHLWQQVEVGTDSRDGGV